MSFVVWLTGLPASGKSTLAAALAQRLSNEGLDAVRLESDRLRPILAPELDYAPAGRERFYRALAGLAAHLERQGFPVVVDATAPRRETRERARQLASNFLEIHVATPLAVCEARDPKGLYRLAKDGAAPHLPGVGDPYEEPLDPDLVVPGTEPAAHEAARVVELLRHRRLITPRAGSSRPSPGAIPLHGPR